MRQFGGPGQYDYGNGITSDSSGNIYVTGDTSSDLDGNTLIGEVDFFVIKYDSLGEKLWTKQLGIAGTVTWGKGITSDSSDNVYVTGSTGGNLDGNKLTGKMDLFVTKYNSSGLKQWTRQLGDSPSSSIWDSQIIADSSANLYVIATLDSGQLNDGTHSEFILVKYSSDGLKQWTQKLSVPEKESNFEKFSLDTKGNIYLVGQTTIGLGGDTLTGIQDLFVIKFNSSGVKQWTRQLGLAGKETYGGGITSDFSGNVFVTGYTEGGLDGNKQMGILDFFVVKYNSSGEKQ